MQPRQWLTSAPVSSSIQGLPMLAATAALSVRNWLANSWLVVGENPQLEGSAREVPKSDAQIRNEIELSFQIARSQWGETPRNSLRVPDTLRTRKQTLEEFPSQSPNSFSSHRPQHQATLHALGALWAGHPCLQV